MKRILIIFFSIACLVIHASENPTVRFTHSSTLNGLPNDFILSIVQDTSGFIWFGTHLGIVRYDGYRFQLYQPDPYNHKSISYKHVSKMHADKRGNIWIKFTENALNRFKTETGEIFNYSENSKVKGSISSLRVNSFFEDIDSTLWIATKEGLNRFNYTNNTFQSVLPKSINNKTYPNNYIYSVTDDTLGNIWFRSSNGIGRYNKQNKKVVSLGEIVKRSEINDYNITSIISDRKSKLWFTTWSNGVFCYNITSGKLNHFLKNEKAFIAAYIDKSFNVYFFSDNNNTLYYSHNDSVQIPFQKVQQVFNKPNNVRFLRFAEDKLGNIWISSFLGLDRFNINEGLFHFKADNRIEESLHSNTINYIFIDKTNNLWVSNYRSGFDKADLNQKPFHKSFTNPNQSNNVFTGNNITAILEDSENNLWIGGNGQSIIKLDNKTGKQIPIKLKNYEQTNFSAIFEDSKGDIWVGNYNVGVERINSNSHEVEYQEIYSKWGDYKEHIRGVRKFIEDKNGDIWMATITGVHKWIRRTNKIIPYSYIHDRHDPIRGFYRTIFIDKHGTLWSGSYNGGMAQYNTNTDKVKRYVNIPGDTTSISGNGVYIIYEETDSTFLVGTTFGLNHFNKNTEKFSLLKTKPSLYNYSIYSIIPDLLGNYWLATDNGLICLNKRTKDCIFYNQADGLPANEFNTTASNISKNGTIYLGTPKGLVSFNPNTFLPNPYPAKPTITNLLINNKTVLPGDTINGRVILKKQIWATPKLELYHYENDFQLQLSAMHFAVPKNNHFWYKLEGYKNGWIELENNTSSVNFTGLPSGDYKFMLKATNNDGVLNPANSIAEINIIIHPPIWKTWWFKLILIVFVAFIIWFIYNLRIRNIEATNLLLENKVSQRTSELQSANKMLLEHKEKLISQKEILENTNKNLKESQKQVISQNKELDMHRNILEKLVKERTNKLLKALDKAKESDRLKSSFLANMSHEIRTPMNAIIGFTSLLNDNKISSKERKFYTSLITKNSESLLVLINDILDISLIESDQIKFTNQEVSLKEILIDCYEVLKIENTKKDIEILLNIDLINDDIILSTDQVRLKQVITNLFINALKFTKTGKIEFGVSNISNCVTLFVKDTGVGIPQSIGENIFNRFTKLEKGTNELYRGAGLGLSICKSLVELWKGKIWYESELDIGTTFYFTHPIRSNAKSKLQQATTTSSKIPHISDKTILIAEDEFSNYQLLCAYLNELNPTIVWAKNGEEACNIVKTKNIHLVLMDIKMPIMNGIEAAKKIKSHFSKLPIIAQTAFSQTNEKDLSNKNLFNE